MKIGLYYSYGGSVLSLGPIHLSRDALTVGRWRLRLRRAPVGMWRRPRLPRWTYLTHNLVRWHRGSLELGLQLRWGNLWVGWHRMRTMAGQHTWICPLPCLVFHVLVDFPGRGSWAINPRTGKRYALVQVGPRYRFIWPPRKASREQVE